MNMGWKMMWIHWWNFDCRTSARTAGGLPYAPIRLSYQKLEAVDEQLSIKPKHTLSYPK